MPRSALDLSAWKCCKSSLGHTSVAHKDHNRHAEGDYRKPVKKAPGKIGGVPEHAKGLKERRHARGQESCSEDYQEDLKDSHARETRAIEFYKKAAAESENARVKEIFEAFVEVETDHLKLSEQRIKE